MVKIVHLADTHLGYRARKGAQDKWAIQNYSRPYEQEIYDTFLAVIEKVSNLNDLDFLVHCGDIFHLPYKDNPYPPPEPARKILKKALEVFFKNTHNKIPFIYIEGNHGIYKNYNYTPFETHYTSEEYPHLYYFKEEDLRNAIRTNTSLKLQFDDLNTDFYLFPYFEFADFPQYKSAYNQWIMKQKPSDTDRINIAIAHGSTIDDTLHPKIAKNEFNYDYVALGHEHALNKVSATNYYAGSCLPLNFKEIHENQGYIIAEINENSKKLEVERIFTSDNIKRPFKMIEIETTPEDSTDELQQKIHTIIVSELKDSKFDPSTAARLKLSFIGEITFEKNWKITNLMNHIRRELFSQPEKYNLYQLIWQVKDISKFTEDDISPGTIAEFILESPEEEYKIFISEKLSESKTHYDLDKLTTFGMNSIKKALKLMEKEQEE